MGSKHFKASSLTAMLSCQTLINILDLMILNLLLPWKSSFPIGIFLSIENVEVYINNGSIKDNKKPKNVLLKPGQSDQYISQKSS